MADTVEKNIKLNIDSDIEPTLKNLRELKLALKSAAAGSDDFRKIQAKIDDVQDSLKGAKTSAGNFVDILGTVPGPLGDIGSKASGTIDILKSFGKLKLTDIKKSFMDLGGDLKDAAKGLGNLTGLTKVYTKTNDFLSASFIKLGAAEGTAAVGAKAFSAALISTGIGALVVGLGLLIGALIEFASGEKAATAEIDKFNAGIEAGNRLIEDQTATLVREHQKQIADLKATGASEKAIRDKELAQRQEDVVDAQNNEAKKLADLKRAYQIEDDDNRKAAIEKAEDAYRAATKTRKDLDTSYYVKAKENRGADLKDTQKAEDEAKKKADEKAKEAAAKAKQYNLDRKEAKKELISKEQELELNQIQDQNERAKKQAEFTRKNDLAALEETKKTEKEKVAFRENIEKAYGITLFEIKKKQIEDQANIDKELALATAKTADDRKAIEVAAVYEKNLKLKELNTEYLASLNQDVSDEGEIIKGKYTFSLGERTKNSYLEKQINQKRKEELAAIDDKYALLELESNKKLAADKLAVDEAELKSNYDKTVKAREDLKGREKLFDDDGIGAKIKYYKDLEELTLKNLEAEKKALNDVNLVTVEEQNKRKAKIEEIDKKIAENKKSVGEEIAKAEEDRNLLSLDKIDGYLQAATALVSAFSDFVNAQNALQAQNTREKYDQQEADAYMSYKADMENSALTAAQKDKIKFDYDQASADRAYDRALQEYEDSKTGFENGKKIQYAQATIGGIQGAIGAFSALAPIPVVGPVLGGIAAAAVAASTIIQLAMISKTNYSGKKPLPPIKQDAAGGGGAGSSGSKFAQGGLLTGRKHAEGGIPTAFGELEGGEYVVNRSATEAFLPLLEKINGMGKGSGAPNNLSVAGEQAVAQPAPIIKTYVVATEMSSQQEANKLINDIARL